MNKKFKNIFELLYLIKLIKFQVIIIQTLVLYLKILKNLNDDNLVDANIL
jgi:hypothetical protein